MGLRRGRRLRLRAKGDQLEQEFVALPFELGDGAAGGLGLHAGDQCGAELRGELGFAEVIPPAGEGTGKMREKMFHPALAAAEVKNQVRAHHAPAQARAPRDGGVYIADAEDALVDEVDGLAPDRGLQAVRSWPGSSVWRTMGRLPMCA